MELLAETDGDHQTMSGAHPLQPATGCCCRTVMRTRWSTSRSLCISLPHICSARWRLLGALAAVWPELLLLALTEVWPSRSLVRPLKCSCLCQVVATLLTSVVALALACPFRVLRATLMCCQTAQKLGSPTHNVPSLHTTCSSALCSAHSDVHIERKTLNDRMLGMKTECGGAGL